MSDGTYKGIDPATCAISCGCSHNECPFPMEHYLANQARYDGRPVSPTPVKPRVSAVRRILLKAVRRLEELLQP